MKAFKIFMNYDIFFVHPFKIISNHCYFDFLSCFLFIGLTFYDLPPMEWNGNYWFGWPPDTSFPCIMTRAGLPPKSCNLEYREAVCSNVQRLLF